MEAWEIPFTKAIKNTLVPGAIVSLRISEMTVLYSEGLKVEDDDTTLDSLIGKERVKIPK